MKTKSGKLLAVLSVLLILAGLTACSNMFETNDSNDSAKEGSATVSFRLNSKRVSARTALPSLDFSAYTFTILAKSNKGVEKTLAEGLTHENLSQKFALARDVWTFTVQAFTKAASSDSEKMLVLEGSSQEIDLLKSNKADVDMTLTAAASGTGKVRIPVTYSTAGVGSVEVALYDKAVGGTVVEGTQKTFTSADGITKNADGSYSLQYDAENLPSGKTYYACFVLYDEAGEPASYYTEAVYIIAGETSTPVIYVKDADGSVKTDDSGNPVVDTVTTEVTVEPNLFETAIIYEAANTESGESREIIVKNTTTEKEYTLYDEDGDGVYDNSLPPGKYDVVSVKTTDVSGTIETKDISEENISVDISTDITKNTVVAAKLSEVKVDVSDSGVENPIVSATLSAEAYASDGSLISDSLYTIQWYRKSANSTLGGTKIEGATGLDYVLTAADAENYVYAEIVQTDKNISKASTPKLVAKGTLKESALTVKYGSAADAIVLNSETILDIALVQPETGSSASPKATLSNALLSVSNAIDNLSGAALSASAIFSKNDFAACGSVDVTVSVSGYESVTIKGIKVNVKQTKPDLEKIPGLVSGEGVKAIKVGCVAFERADDSLEYAVGEITESTVWKSITIEDFAAEVGDKISVRVKASGSAESGDYVAPSEAVTLTVTQENAGDLEVKMTKVVMTGTSRVGATLTAKAMDDDEKQATLVSYQWLIAETEAGPYTAISDYTEVKTDSDTYLITPDDVGKFIKVRAKQGKGEQNILESEEVAESIAKGTIKSYIISYVESEGADPVEISAVKGITLTLNDEGKAELSGTVSVSDAVDELSELPVSVGAAFSTTTEFEYCGTVSVKITAEGYEDAIVNVPVSVMAKAPEVPLLRTDKTYLESGTVGFVAASETLEYSVDGGESYSDVTAIPFYKGTIEAGGNIPWAQGDVILVRVKASGSEAESNHIEASVPVSLIVSEDNLGAKVLLETVAISVPASSLKVGSTLSAVTTPSGATDVEYQWARADSASGTFTAITGATSSTYVIKASDAGKFIKVTATQRTSESVPSDVSTTAVAKGTIASGFTLTYGGSTISASSGISLTLDAEGNASLSGSPSVSGAKDSVNNNAVSASASFSTSTTFTHCGAVSVKVSASGYDDAVVTIPVKVKAATPEAPQLSINQAEISAGAVAFAAASETLEYSVDGGTSWKSVTTTRFYTSENDAWEADDTILVRVKASGSEADSNHIEASAPVTVTVEADNLGEKPTASFGEITYTGDIRLANPQVNNEAHTVTISVSNPDLFTAFEWKKDNVIIEGATGPSLELNVSDWVAGGVYRITVVGTQGDFKYSATVPVTKQ
ncbi:hypothetical protein [uncultured Treponema sp.]|uniref:hypothetical protein n=1 Tax=uncultured Treponema sp. TaxID=162155 RepID=UPI0025D2F4F9|nr:hypothetical protein [uncultured Treponema sp.]